MRNFAFDLSAFELDDLAARAEDNLVELLEAFDLLRAKRGKQSHWQILPKFNPRCIPENITFRRGFCDTPAEYRMCERAAMRRSNS